MVLIGARPDAASRLSAILYLLADEFRMVREKISYDYTVTDSNRQRAGTSFEKNCFADSVGLK
ncbi:MAG TPA: hypothetical protein PLQ76_09085 [bacterium]|nr:hypothetical protein [bacterium]